MTRRERRPGCLLFMRPLRWRRVTKYVANWSPQGTAPLSTLPAGCGTRPGAPSASFLPPLCSPLWAIGPGHRARSGLISDRQAPLPLGLQPLVTAAAATTRSRQPPAAAR